VTLKWVPLPLSFPPALAGHNQLSWIERRRREHRGAVGVDGSGVWGDSVIWCILRCF